MQAKERNSNEHSNNNGLWIIHSIAKENREQELEEDTEMQSTVMKVGFYG